MNLQKNIDKMKLELAEMEKQLKAEKQIKLQGGGWYMHSSGTVNFERTQIDYTDNGLERATKELAIEMRDRIITSSQIEARAREIDPNWVADWTNFSPDKTKYFIERQWESGLYTVGATARLDKIGVPYGSKSTMNKICKEINEGRFVLGYKN